MNSNIILLLYIIGIVSTLVHTKNSPVGGSGVDDSGGLGVSVLKIKERLCQ